MKKKYINLLLFVINCLLIVYLIYNFVKPLFYNKEFNKNKQITDKEITAVESSFSNYMEACLISDKSKIKSMLPPIKKVNIGKYDDLFSLYEENDVSNKEQNVIYDISKISNNIYQVKFYSKTGSIVDGLLRNTVIIQINNSSNSFKVLYDKNLENKEE